VYGLNRSSPSPIIVQHSWPRSSASGRLTAAFDRIDHNHLLAAIGTFPGRGMIRDWLKAGVFEPRKGFAPTEEGTPQGGVVSPLLSNIYLHKLDSLVENVLIPEYTRGDRRAANPEYRQMVRQVAYRRRRGDRPATAALRRKMRSIPSKDTADPGFRRLRYVRYCDDHLLGFTGPKAEAQEIKIRLATFLREELKLELSQPRH
jgi:hypothetical protein